MARRTRKTKSPPRAETYTHHEATSPMRPEVGTQAQFKKKKPPRTYRYDSSLSPALDWDGQNAARELGESQLSVVSGQLAELRRVLAAADDGRLAPEQLHEALRSLGLAEEAVRTLKALGRPFLDWAGKAERLSFDVPTLPLFVHERLSTRGILETLASHRKSRDSQLELFGDPQHPIADQVLRAYEYPDRWVNRLILGDSLVVMNSLLGYESLGGQVQMIYIDPPYGVKFGSNFQPFVRRRDVKHGDDGDMTREPEMVQAYRDTWELGLHSYLTYLRDRLLLARELLHPSGSVFVQISDENLHHVREVMDEVFGAENFCAAIVLQKTSGLSSPTAKVNVISTINDFLLWYARDSSRVMYNQLYVPKVVTAEETALLWLEDSNGDRRRLTREERLNPTLIPSGAKLFRLDPIISQGFSHRLSQPLTFVGRTYSLAGNHHWKTTPEGMQKLGEVGRLVDSAGTLRYVRYIDDFPVSPLQNLWTDTGTGQFTEKRSYVVQTSTKAVARCLLMTTDPGDLVLDPTCGSGTTAYVAEQWGRRWITIDTSRVPLALARQRLLTATFPWYELKDEARGPAGGFLYKRKQNRKGEEVGGIVPHVTLKSIANNEPPKEEVLVDRPEETSGITRVTGPFCVEATIPTPVDWEADGIEDSGAATAESYGTYVERMIEVLRKSPVLRVDGGRTVTLRQVRPPARSLSLSAEAIVEGYSDEANPTLSDAVQEVMEQDKRSLPLSSRPVAIVFGPENGAVSEKLVYEAAREAHAKSYTRLYVIGFMIQPHARTLVESCEQVMGIPATYVQATTDVTMGDLLKNMRSSQVFSVCGLPEVSLEPGGDGRYQVKLLGFDTFDPATMEVEHRSGTDVPAWLLDTDYNGLCFHVCQAFFPRTSAWDNLKKALKGKHDESVWTHLAGDVSAPFEPGEHGQAAVKVIDDRGNELLVVKKLEEAART